MRKLDVACPHKRCGTYNEFGSKNIVRNSFQSNGIQKLNVMNVKNVVKTINTPFFHKHLTKKEIIHICKLLSEKTSFRAIARITDHHLDTIQSIAEHFKKSSMKIRSALLQRKRSWIRVHVFGIQKKNLVLHLFCGLQMERFT